MPPKPPRNPLALSDREIAKMTKGEREALIAKIDDLMEEMAAQVRDIKESDPFYFFKPSNGELNQEKRDLLKKWLKEDDIPQVLTGQTDVFASTADIIGVFGGNQCLAKGTLVMTPRGPREIENLAIGDTIYGPDGGFAKVTAVYDCGEKPVYALTNRGQILAECTGEHKWLVKDRHHKVQHRQLSDFLRDDMIKRVEVNCPLGFVSEPHAYAIGALLGDGCSRQGSGTRIDISSETQLIPWKVAQILGASDMHRNNGNNYTWSIFFDGKINCHHYNEWVNGFYAHEKKVDLDVVKTWDRNSVLAFIAGLLDTDGSVYTDKHGWTYLQFSTQSPSIFEAFKYCFFALWQVNLSEHTDRRKKYVNGPVFTCRTGVIDYIKRALIELDPHIVTPSKRYKAEWNNRKAKRTRRDYWGVRKTYSGIKQCYDITVSTWGNLYLLANGLVTHNSGKSTTGAIWTFIQTTGEIPEGLKGIFPESQLIKQRPCHIRVTGVDHKQMLNTLIPTYQKWVPRNYLKKGKWRESFSSERNLLTLEKNGKVTGTVEFMTNQMDVESFQGPPKHAMVYDEEPRADVRKENLLRMTTAERVRELYCMTPTKGNTWVKDKILDAFEEDGNSIECFKLTSATNALANEKVIDEILKNLDTYDEVKMRLLGEFVSISGLVYGKLFNRKVHVIEPFPLDYDNYIVYRGLDPHLVKPSVCVEVAVDREENEYVVGCYAKDCDTSEIKKDLAERAKERKYRLGWAMCDKSANSTIKVLGDRNIYRELSRGENAVPALFTSDKYTGSINAGVDEIKQRLRLNEKTGKPTLFIFNMPENKPLIQALETMERDRATNEDKSGVRDKIAEGKWDHHAALRYIHQRTVRWMPQQEDVPEQDGERYI